MKISKRSKVASSKETADRKTDRRISPTNVRYKGYMIRLSVFLSASSKETADRKTDRRIMYPL